MGSVLVYIDIFYVLLEDLGVVVRYIIFGIIVLMKMR